MRRILCSSIGIVLVCTATLAAQVPGVDSSLISSVAKEMGGGATPQQAEAATGAIFVHAKARMSPTDFTKVSGSVPGIDGLMSAAPAMPTAPGASGLGSLTSSLKTVGLSPAQVNKAIPVVSKYVA